MSPGQHDPSWMDGAEYLHRLYSLFSGVCGLLLMDHLGNRQKYVTGFILCMHICSLHTASLYIGTFLSLPI